MTTVKLTKDIREQICRELLVHRYRKQVDALVSRGISIASNLYNILYSRKVQQRMHNQIEGWLAERCLIEVSIPERRGGNLFTYHFNGAHLFYGILVGLKSPDRPVEKRRFLGKHLNGVEVQLSLNNALAKKIEKWVDDETALKEEVQLSQRTIHAMLRSVTTVSKLAKTWPEVAPFLKKFEEGVAPQLPAVQTTQLNELLGLKMQKAA